MTAADIAAARARVVETAAGLRLSAGWTMQPASGRELLARDHALALSDLLLAMTAPEPAPAEPADDKATRIGRELDPTPVVVALEPAPAGPPSLWEWVRAACMSRLGEPKSTAGSAAGGGLCWFGERGPFLTARPSDRHDWSKWYVAKNGVTRATCTTPAELTAALDALAEEVGRG